MYKRKATTSKKIAATVEEPMLREIEEIMEKEKFYETSEFIKHCIRQYLLKHIDSEKASGGSMRTMRPMFGGAVTG